MAAARSSRASRAVRIWTSVGRDVADEKLVEHAGERVRHRLRTAKAATTTTAAGRRLTGCRHPELTTQRRRAACRGSRRRPALPPARTWADSALILCAACTAIPSSCCTDSDTSCHVFRSASVMRVSGSPATATVRVPALAPSTMSVTRYCPGITNGPIPAPSPPPRRPVGFRESASGWCRRSHCTRCTPAPSSSLKSSADEVANGGA